MLPMSHFVEGFQHIIILSERRPMVLPEGSIGTVAYEVELPELPLGSRPVRIMGYPATRARTRCDWRRTVHC